MPEPSYKSETAAMHNKAKELRQKVRTAAKEKNVTVPKSALDNFVATYSKTKVGPIQRAISKFLSGFNTKADYTSGKSTTAKLTAKANANRATSQGGRSRAQVIEENQKRLARKSAAQGGGSVLSNKKKRAATGTYDRGAVETSKPKGKPMTMPTSPPKRPKKKMKTPKPKPKMYTAINVNTGKPDFNAPKVTAAQRLKQEDKFKAKKKALDLVTSAAKKSINKKGKK